MPTTMPYSRFKDDYKITSLLLIVVFIPYVLSFHRRIPIGGLFDSDNDVKKAFDTSVRAANRNRPSFEDVTDAMLVPKIEICDEGTFDLSKKACEIMRSGVTGLFGPQDRDSMNFVQSMCDTMDMVHINAVWYPERMRGNMVNLYPHAETLSMVFATIVQDYKWNEFSVIYENTDSLIRISPFLKLNTSDYRSTIYNLGNGPDYRKLLKTVKKAKHKRIVLDCSIEILPDVLRQAQEVGLMREMHKWLVTSLDLHTLDLDSYRHSGVNITGVRLINPNDYIVQKIFEEEFYDWDYEDPNEIKAEVALMYDAVQLFLQSFLRLKDSAKGTIKRLACNNSDTWGYGMSLSNIIRAEEMQGLTGTIKFDPAGFRTNFCLDIISVTPDGFKQIGNYRNFYIDWLVQGHNFMEEVLPLRNRHFIVLIALTDPYGMTTETSKIMSGNERYEGFAVDIIKELSAMLGFNYTFRVQEDNAYGSIDEKTKEWNGMIRQILDGKADLAITDLTINVDREQAVDFTTPFMNLGISVLYRTPTKAAPSMVSFLMPFSKPVWLCLMVAYAFVSVMFYILGRVSPAEWVSGDPCDDDPEELENQFTFKNSFWFTLGSIMQQGTELAPIGMATRSVVTAWWFFCAILGNTYTANLAAFLTAQDTVWAFEQAEDLVNQDVISYGAKRGGSTLQFFEKSTYPPYKKLYNTIIENDYLMEDSNENGLYRVMAENYAFFMESTSIKYFQQRYCNVTQVGDLLDEKSYGIAMTKNASYRNELTTALLKLKENGIITELEDKWWRQKRGGEKCIEKETQQITALDVADVGGVFVFFIAGTILAIFFTAAELLFYVKRIARRRKVSFWCQLKDEVKFFLSMKDIKVIKEAEDVMDIN